MDIYNSDLHVHSRFSIAVSKSLNLDTMIETSKKKGLNILGTGDILQPDWLKYMENNLEKDRDNAYSYKRVNFILQTEIEDQESVHEIILFPDFNSVHDIQKKFEPHSKNIYGEWGGRPRVNLSPAELVDIIIDAGCIIGPAHAFTPFRAIFRQNKFKNLEECYQDTAKNVHFIELGLSANTDLADRLSCLKDITFLSNSDAHSQDPRSLGREFNKFELDNPSFDEILLALTRKNSRKTTLNVGLHPKLGKYYNMFCNKCRRIVLFRKSKKMESSIFNQYLKTEDFLIYYSTNPDNSKKQYIEQISKNKMVCPACKEEHKKNFKMKLGVSERIGVISQFDKPQHPNHRPKYINAIPLIDIIRSVKGIKSTSSKTVRASYNKMIDSLGSEFDILLDLPIDKIKEADDKVAVVIQAFRNNDIEYTPGGGGTYGQIKLDL